MVKLKLACADFTFPLLSHDGVLDLIAALDLEGVGIGLFQDRSHLQPADEFKNLSRSAKRLARKVSDRGLKVADVYLQMALDFRSWAINHPNGARRKKARDWFLRTLDYASICGATHVTALPGVRNDDEPARDSWGRCCDELAWRLDKARDQELVFSVEPHIGSIAPRPRSALRLVRDVPGLTLTLDYAHFTRQGIPDSEVEPLVQHSSHIHIRGARRGRLQASFSQSTIDFGRVVQVATRNKFRGWFEIEYVYIDWEHCNECDTLAETIQYRDYLRALKV